MVIKKTTAQTMVMNLTTVVNNSASTPKSQHLSTRYKHTKRISNGDEVFYSTNHYQAF